jgi:phage FluMu protein Com
MWSDGEPIDPSPTIDQAVNGGFPWLEIRCARCKTPSDVDLAAMKHPPTTFVHDLASRLRCRKCGKAGRRPAATLLQLAWQPRHPLERSAISNGSRPTRPPSSRCFAWSTGRRPAADAGSFPGLQGADRTQRSGGPRARNGEMGMLSSQHALWRRQRSAPRN